MTQTPVDSTTVATEPPEPPPPPEPPAEQPAAEEPAAGEPAAEAPAAPSEPDSDRFTFIVGLGFWVVIGALIAMANDSSREFLARWWWAIVGGAALAGAAAFMPSGRRWLLGRSANTRAAFIIFGAVPLLLLLIGSVAVLPVRYQVTALRVVFLLVVCLLPATMWYLFIATRKASILNEFLANLDRLGLLRSSGTSAGPPDETLPPDTSRSRRISSYLQRFEAIYGDLPDTIHEDVLNNRFRKYSRAEMAGSTALSTTTVPVMFSTVLVALGWLITLPPGEVPPTGATSDSWIRALQPNASPVTLAFLGAYFFSFQMLFRRYVLKDLRGSAYVAAAMRIILAVIGIWVLMAAQAGLDIFTTDQLLVAGFVIGVFPLVVWQIVQAVFKRMSRIAVRSMVSELPIGELDGLTVWHEARLEEEDIENIPNMATADLVELLLNTRVPPERIIDWTDQAILYTQLGPRGSREPQSPRQRLRRHGIRTATALLWAAEEADRRGRRAAFDAILKDGDGTSVMPALEATLVTNSNLALVQRWRGLSRPTSVGVDAGVELGQAGAGATPAGGDDLAGDADGGLLGRAGAEVEPDRG